MNTRALSSVGEHRYYIAVAIGVIVVVMAGFSIDVPLLSRLGSLSVLVRAHGLIMLTWIALFFAQAVLVARHRVDLPMRLGISIERDFRMNVKRESKKNFRPGAR